MTETIPKVAAIVRDGGIGLLHYAGQTRALMAKSLVERLGHGTVQTVLNEVYEGHPYAMARGFCRLSEDSYSSFGCDFYETDIPSQLTHPEEVANIAALCSILLSMDNAHSVASSSTKVH
ncbi:MAG: hypothetical protein ABIA93_03685 [Candidatus Woesearchaeota archaeon]